MTMGLHGFECLRVRSRKRFKRKGMLSMIDVKVKYLSEKATEPKYATDGSLGMDLAAALEEPVVLKSGERIAVPTGLAIQIPDGWGAFVFPRSGLSLRSGITMCNCVGVIDTDYTGELKVAVINVSDKDFTINSGDRIAQLVFLPVEKARLVRAESLDDTERGAGGFGSTGIQA